LFIIKYVQNVEMSKTLCVTSRFPWTCLPSNFWLLTGKNEENWL